ARPSPRFSGEPRHDRAAATSGVAVCRNRYSHGGRLPDHRGRRRACLRGRTPRDRRHRGAHGRHGNRSTRSPPRDDPLVRANHARPVSKDPARTPGTSWALQGCLFGAVALFVGLLLLMIFLAYRRFRENTDVLGFAASAPVQVITTSTMDHG